VNAKVTPARRAAFDALRRVETQTAYASHLLASEAKPALGRPDRALLQELTLGVLRWQGLLDFLIERYARRPVSGLDPDVTIVLRLGLYQLRFLDRIPAHAAINESVNLTRERKLASAAPFVNAVLRAAQREAETGIHDLILSINDPLLRLSVETSHPPWLIERWLMRYGEGEARALALAGNSTPPVAFRFNPGRSTIDQTRAWFADNGISIRDSTLAPQAAVIASGHLTADSEPVREGWIYVQDEASQLVAHVAAANAVSSGHTLRVLDVCAAPGGKTSLVAALAGIDAQIVAADLHHHRLLTMKALAARLGVPPFELIQLDAAQQLPFSEPGRFDIVLLDAPCSGLGSLQRHPEIKWRAKKEKIGELAALQKQLISQAVRQLRPGGLLTYSVCSTEPEEGEEVVASLRLEHPELRDVTRERLLELGLGTTDLLTSNHGARTFTHRHGSESFFLCVFWKRR